MKMSDAVAAICGISVATILLIVMLFISCLINSEDKGKDHNASYQWAIKFCGGENNIRSFYAYDTLPDRVYCTSSRQADIPTPVELEEKGQ